MEKYIWFSGATDITGAALADSLGVKGTRSKPKNLKSGDIVIGWGVKEKNKIVLPNGVVVLNHPDNIRSNRNKLNALDIMSKNDEVAKAIADYCTADKVGTELKKQNSKIKLPLVGRTKYHQGGKGFWLCLTEAQVNRAVGDGAGYFQNYVDIDKEYRLHVAFGKVIYAVKKIENVSEEGWKNQRKKKIDDYAKKNKWNVDENTVDKTLGILFKEATLPDRIVRSNRRGWKFSSVKLDSVNSSLKKVAIKSVEVMGLDFGAVDCAMGVDGNPYIIEINTGPGLEGTAFERYVKAFKDKLKEMESPAAKPKKEAPKKPTKVAKAAAAGAEEGGLMKVMNNVKSDEEARALIEALMKEKS